MPLFLIFASLAAVSCGHVSAQAVTTISAPATPTGDATLTIRFEDLTAPTGQILISLFASETAHDSGGQPVRTGMVKVQGGAPFITLTGLAPGRYAIKVLHDVDGNGQMLTNPFGMPLEPFAFSNGARAQGGPAKWSDASFDVPAGTSETRITFK